MQVLAAENENRAFDSVWAGQPSRGIELAAGTTEPLAVGLLSRIRNPWNGQIFTVKDVSDWSIQATINDNIVATLATNSSSANTQTPPPVLVTQGDSTHNHRVRITLPATRYGGEWTFTVNAAVSETIGYDDSDAQIEVAIAALSTVGAGNVEVTQETADNFLVEFIAAKGHMAISGIAIDGSTLKVLSLKSGTIDLRSDAVTTLVTAADALVRFRIQGVPAAGTQQTLLQRDILLTQPVAGYTPTPTLVAGLTGSGTPIAVSATGTSDLAPATQFIQWYQSVAASAGSGAYTYNLTLDNTLAQSGAEYTVLITLPASANPTIRIYDNTTAGTLLDTIAGDSSNATTYNFVANFDGTNWHKTQGEYL